MEPTFRQRRKAYRTDYGSGENSPPSPESPSTLLRASACLALKLVQERVSILDMKTTRKDNLHLSVIARPYWHKSRTFELYSKSAR